jgi:MFS family permease
VADDNFYTSRYWLLCFSIFLFFMSFNMIVPELPAHLTKLGGQEYKGWTIALFTLTAGLSRPFSGKLADKVGRIPVIFFGIIVSTAAIFCYPFFQTVTLFLILRLLHGFSTGFTPTGASAYLADIVPAHRRGEAMGIYGTMSSLGMAIAPALGGWLAFHHGINTTFYTAGGISVLAVLMTFSLRETLPQKQPFSPQLLQLKRTDIFEPQAIGPALVYGLCFFGFGVVLTVGPDMSEWLGIANKGWYFTVSTVASLFVRAFAGKVSDRYGRVLVLKISSLWYVGAMVAAAFAQGPGLFFTSAALLGLGIGMLSPTVLAWTVDLSNDQNRGRALATLYIALEMGIGLGAWSSGAIYANQAANFPLVFGLAALLAFGSFGYLWFFYRPKKA